MKILIVDDDRILTNIWERRFGRDHEVTVRKTIKDALELIESGFIPDLVFLDLRLNGPKESGLIVYNEIRKRYDIPIVIITGLEDSVPLHKEAHSLLKKDEQLNLVQKPIDMGTIRGFINSYVPAARC